MIKILVSHNLSMSKALIIEIRNQVFAFLVDNINTIVNKESIKVDKTNS